MTEFARVLIFIGVIIILMGGLLLFFARNNINLENLPGNIHIIGDNFSCIIAVGASINLSNVLTLLLNIVINK